MKKLTFFILTAILFSTCQNDKNDAIKIGATLPLTGTIAAYGNYMKQGLELAYMDAIKSGLIEESKVTIIYEDDQAIPNKSISSFNKLINVDQVVASFSATSGVTLALKPIANNNEVILMNASAISTEIEDKPDYMFSVIPDANLTGTFIAEQIYSRLKKMNAGILYRNDASGKSFYNVFKNKFKSFGGNIVYEEAHKINNTDFKPFILKLKNIKKIDVLFVASWGPEVAYFIKQAKESNLKLQVITYETFNSPKVIEIAGDAANTVVFSSPKILELEDTNQYLKFKQKINDKFNHNEVNYYILGHYDALTILLNAINKGNTSSNKIKDYLNEMDTYDGITGKIKFNDNGGVILPLYLYTVKDGQFIKY